VRSSLVGTSAKAASPTEASVPSSRRFCGAVRGWGGQVGWLAGWLSSGASLAGWLGGWAGWAGGGAGVDVQVGVLPAGAGRGPGGRRGGPPSWPGSVRCSRVLLWSLLLTVTVASAPGSLEVASTFSAGEPPEGWGGVEWGGVGWGGMGRQAPAWQPFHRATSSAQAGGYAGAVKRATAGTTAAASCTASVALRTAQVRCGCRRPASGWALTGEEVHVRLCQPRGALLVGCEVGDSHARRVGSAVAGAATSRARLAGSHGAAKAGA
jgi:hypothetical protein